MHVRGILLVGGFEFSVVHVLPIPGRLLKYPEVSTPRVRMRTRGVFFYGVFSLEYAATKLCLNR